MWQLNPLIHLDIRLLVMNTLAFDNCDGFFFTQNLPKCVKWSLTCSFLSQNTIKCENTTVKMQMFNVISYNTFNVSVLYWKMFFVNVFLKSWKMFVCPLLVSRGSAHYSCTFGIQLIPQKCDVVLVTCQTRTPYCATYTKEWWWGGGEGWLKTTTEHVKPYLNIKPCLNERFAYWRALKQTGCNCSARDWVNHITEGRVS